MGLFNNLANKFNLVTCCFIFVSKMLTPLFPFYLLVCKLWWHIFSFYANLVAFLKHVSLITSSVFQGEIVILLLFNVFCSLSGNH